MQRLEVHDGPDTARQATCQRLQDAELKSLAFGSTAVWLHLSCDCGQTGEDGLALRVSITFMVKINVRQIHQVQGRTLLISARFGIIFLGHISVLSLKKLSNCY